MHNDAVNVLGSCRCACHALRAPGARARCWCDPRKAATRPAGADAALADEDLDELRAAARRAGVWLDAPQIAHNDAVAHFGSCRCTCHTSRTAACWCAGHTAPEVAAALTRKAERDLRKRLATGRATPAEYARHAPWMLTGRRRP